MRQCHFCCWTGHPSTYAHAQRLESRVLGHSGRELSKRDVHELERLDVGREACEEAVVGLLEVQVRESERRDLRQVEENVFEDLDVREDALPATKERTPALEQPTRVVRTCKTNKRPSVESDTNDASATMTQDL